MLIDNYLQGTDNRIYYSEGFRKFCEDSMSWLSTQPTTLKQIIEPSVAIRFSGDFYGLLAYYKIPYELHWLCMRMSGYHSTFDFEVQDNVEQSFLRPALQVIQQMVSLYQSSNTATAS